MDSKKSPKESLPDLDGEDDLTPPAKTQRARRQTPAQVLRDALREKVTIVEGGHKRVITAEEAMLKQLVKRALEGHKGAWKIAMKEGIALEDPADLKGGGIVIRYRKDKPESKESVDVGEGAPD